MGPIGGPGGGMLPILGSASGGVLRSPGPDWWHRWRRGKYYRGWTTDPNTHMQLRQIHLLPLCAPVHQAQGCFLCMCHLHWNERMIKGHEQSGCRQCFLFRVCISTRPDIHKGLPSAFWCELKMIYSTKRVQDSKIVQRKTQWSHDEQLYTLQWLTNHVCRVRGAWGKNPWMERARWEGARRGQKAQSSWRRWRSPVHWTSWFCEHIAYVKDTQWETWRFIKIISAALSKAVK